jgi:quercetin dioxygenase-like cupin family protein
LGTFAEGVPWRSVALVSSAASSLTVARRADVAFLVAWRRAELHANPPKKCVPTMPNYNNKNHTAGHTLPETNPDVAAMVEAEVNEGGPPSPEPCETMADQTSCPEAHGTLMQTSPTLEACPAPDRVIHLPLGQDLRGTKSSTLLKSAGLELVRLVIPAGKEIPPHRAPGEITVQCVEGQIAFQHDGKTLELNPGDMLCLCPKETHSLKGLKDSTVLVTLLRLHAEDLPE